MKNSIKSIFVLVCISAVVSVLMALTNYVTAPIIEGNEQLKANSALLEVLPEGKSFSLKDTSSLTLPATVSEVYSAENGGYVVKLTTTGYSSGMVIMCGISPDGNVVNSKIISSTETPSIGGVAAETFAEKVKEKNLETIDAVDTISGATKTTAAYRSAIKDALNTVIILGGGSVDLRSEEEILLDNLTAVLPSSEGAFEKYFFTEDLEGITSVYVAENGTGMIFEVNETFLAVDSDMNVLSECDEETASLILSSVNTINESTAESIDLASYEGLSKRLVKADVTASGNYIMEIEGAGYGITGGDEYHPASGKYILIKVCMTPEGKILDCLTLYEEETDGIGSVCADEKFYSQFDGRTPDNYDGIDSITGATLTTDGYKKAIVRAYESVRIFEEAK